MNEVSLFCHTGVQCRARKAGVLVSLECALHVQLLLFDGKRGPGTAMLTCHLVILLMPSRQAFRKQEWELEIKADTDHSPV